MSPWWTTTAISRKRYVEELNVRNKQLQSQHGRTGRKTKSKRIVDVRRQGPTRRHTHTTRYCKTTETDRDLLAGRTSMLGVGGRTVSVCTGVAQAPPLGFVLCFQTGPCYVEEAALELASASQVAGAPGPAPAYTSSPVCDSTDLIGFLSSIPRNLNFSTLCFICICMHTYVYIPCTFF